MPAAALSLTLAAALVHAAWNLLLSAARDTRAAAAVAVAVGTVMFAPAAALTWRMSPQAVPFIAGSSVLEALYLLLLSTGYARAEMGFVYPIARGSAPLFVLLVSGLVLGAAVSALTVAGVLLIAAGIVLVRGLHRAERRADLALAFGIGACIAGYTLVDKHGITHASPLAYIEIVFAITAAANLIGVAVAGGGGPALRAQVTLRTLLAGAGFFGSYALVLAALRLAPAASVAAVRESGVVIAAAYLAISGREHAGPARLVGAFAVAGGIALVALG